MSHEPMYSSTLRPAVEGASSVSPKVLIVPGWSNSGPDHWQSHWERAHPESRRVEQQDWDTPDLTDWVTTLDEAIRAAKAPVALVAHSLGCITIAHWVARFPGRAHEIAAALLVAPADIERVDAPAVLRHFGPIPLLQLHFPSVVVASTTDPYASLERAQAFAAAWGSRFVNLGDTGHINTAAGFGPWSAGKQLLAELLAETASKGSLDA